MKKTTLLALLLITEVALGQSEKWTSLFDGKSLAGWHNYNKTGEISNKWVVEEASIHLTGSGGGDLVSDAEFENFVLEIEWKISEGGNSGVMWGVQEDKKYFAPWVTGPEMQVLDDAKHPDSFAGKNGNHKAGALYDMVPPSRLDAVKPANEWNKAKMTINHKTNEGIFELNGVKTAQFKLSGPEWDALKQDSKFKPMAGFGSFAKGKIAIQDHGDKVWFRNIRIKSL